MKQILAPLLVVAILIQYPLPVQAQSFSDTEFSWYRTVIDDLRRDGVITGYDDGTFKPKEHINRAEFLTIVMRSITGTTPGVGTECFADVASEAWYAPWVCTAKRRGIIQGYPGRTTSRGGTALELFKPEQTVNFAEAVKIVARLLDDTMQEQGGEEWYKLYTSYLHDEGIVSQYSYIPWELLNRERAADLLYRYRQLTVYKRESRESIGCGNLAPNAPPSTIRVQGVNRNFTVRVPNSYRSNQAVPLLFAFHGRTNSAQMVRSYYRFDREWPDAIIVYPEGISNGNGSYSWSNGGDSAQTLRGYLLFDAIAQRLMQEYCIDTYQIYAAGHSLGGWISNSLGCVRGDIIRGTASVGSSGVITQCYGPSAGMFIHNPNDRLAGVAGGEATRNARLESTTCGYNFIPSNPRSLLCEESSCNAPGNPVLWCPHNQDYDYRGEYYPHNWPRGTGKEIVQFFKELPK